MHLYGSIARMYWIQIPRVLSSHLLVCKSEEQVKNGLLSNPVLSYCFPFKFKSLPNTSDHWEFFATRGISRRNKESLPNLYFILIYFFTYV
jgi:hypothetical protein